MKGMNLQGVVRSRIHPGKTYNQMIDSIAEVLRDLGVTACRIGGTPMEGAKFDEDSPGYGRLGETVFDNYNYPIAMLDVLQAAGIRSVHICLHNRQGPDKMTDADVRTIVQLCRSRGIEMMNVDLADDNEQYSPARTQEGSFDYEIMRANRSRLQQAGYRVAWPLLFASPEETDNRRKRREFHTQGMLEGVNASNPANQLFEVHVYCPRERANDPVGFLGQTFQYTREYLSFFGFQGESAPQFVVGEWSGKNQETFGDEELEHVIQQYLPALERVHAHYYQLLGSEFDVHGLFNFRTGTPNRGYEIFKNA